LVVATACFFFDTIRAFRSRMCAVTVLARSWCRDIAAAESADVADANHRDSDKECTTSTGADHRDDLCWRKSVAMSLAHETETESKAIADAAASLQARYPTAPPALIRSCVGDAIGQVRDARIRLYVSILIERRAGESVREAIRSSARRT
jgi:hypothetical protein